MKLIAYDITNLTDARYFAARGACMVGFSATMSSIEQVNAIKDWVDVPAFFLHLPAEASPELIWEWQERTGISTFLISSISEGTMALFPQAKWITFFNGQDIDYEPAYLFITAEHLNAWKEAEISLDETKVYVDFKANQADLDIDDEITGVIIKGSDEDKVGVKSYDAIDDYLDKIEVEY